MTYREKLELYSQGKLDEQQTKEIERELEKQEALADYLFEHQAPPGMDDLFDGTSPFGIDKEQEASEVNEETEDESAAIAKQINSSIRRAFIKTGVIATMIAVILTLFIVFALPHIVSAFYYDPHKTVETVWSNESEEVIISQLERDMSVYAELAIPELGPSISAGTDGYGYGNYTYYFDACFNVGENAEKTIENVFNGTIKRGNFTCYNYKELNRIKEAKYFNADYQEYDKSFEEMSTARLYYAYVSFTDTIPYERYYADYVDQDEYGTNVSWVWCGIQVSPDENETYHLKHGFFATPYQDQVYFKGDDDHPDLAWNDAADTLNTEAKAKKHFDDMLSYLIENDEFNNLEGNLEPFVDEGEREYISENGLNVYGFVYVGDKEHIEKVAEAKEVKHVSVELAM